MGTKLIKERQTCLNGSCLFWLLHHPFFSYQIACPPTCISLQMRKSTQSMKLDYSTSKSHVQIVHPPSSWPALFQVFPNFLCGHNGVGVTSLPFPHGVRLHVHNSATWGGVGAEDATLWAKRWPHGSIIHIQPAAIYECALGKLISHGHGLYVS